MLWLKCWVNASGISNIGRKVKDWVRGLVRVRGRKPNMLQECFNLSQLPSPDEGLVMIKLSKQEANNYRALENKNLIVSPDTRGQWVYFSLT